VAELESHDVQRPGEQIDVDVDMNRAVLIDPETNRSFEGEGNGQAAETRHQAVRDRSARAEGQDPARRRPVAVFDNGALRYIKLGETEVLRAMAFLVRDENWGTFTPEISNLKIRQGKSDFRVSYDARCKDAKRSLSYRAEISCGADGALRFDAVAFPESDFLTNRTGFIVLHPLTGVAGFRSRSSMSTSAR
jgi:hypothetical protein